MVLVQWIDAEKLFNKAAWDDWSMNECLGIAKRNNSWPDLQVHYILFSKKCFICTKKSYCTKFEYKKCFYDEYCYLLNTFSTPVKTAAARTAKTALQRR